MTAGQPTPQGISRLLRKAGFTRSTYGDKGVMWNEASPGYSAWKTFHGDHSEHPYVAVQHVTRSEGDWDERKAESRSWLEKYAAVLRGAGFAAVVRDRGTEPPWLIIMTVVTTGEE
jgi:hypothetical protein